MPGTDRYAGRTLWLATNCSKQHAAPDQRHAVERGLRQSRARTELLRARRRSVIEFRGVSKHYPSGDIGLEQVTFSVDREEFVFLVGSTGSGKSTVMRLLIKELEPTGGNDPRRGPRPAATSAASGCRTTGATSAWCSRTSSCCPNRTVYDNVAYALQVTGGTRREIREKVPDILRLTGLSTKLHNYPDQLSGGEQQRVSIARAFVNHPPLLLADEPTGNLDPETSIDIMRLLYRINRTGTTVLVATHDQAMVDKMRRRVLELSHGRIVRDEATGLYARDETTREFARRLRSPNERPPGV